MKKKGTGPRLRTIKKLQDAMNFLKGIDGQTSGTKLRDKTGINSAEIKAAKELNYISQNSDYTFNCNYDFFEPIMARRILELISKQDAEKYKKSQKNIENENASEQTLINDETIKEIKALRNSPIFLKTMHDWLKNYNVSLFEGEMETYLDNFKESYIKSGTHANTTQLTTHFRNYIKSILVSTPAISFEKSEKSDKILDLLEKIWTGISMSYSSIDTIIKGGYATKIFGGEPEDDEEPVLGFFDLQEALLPKIGDIDVRVQQSLILIEDLSRWINNRVGRELFQNISKLEKDFGNHYPKMIAINDKLDKIIKWSGPFEESGILYKIIRKLEDLTKSNHSENEYQKKYLLKIFGIKIIEISKK